MLIWARAFLLLQVWRQAIIHLVRQIRNRLDPGEWALLSMDQYACHVEDFWSLKYCWDNKILCYSPHSHSSSYTQVLDVAIIQPVKVVFRQLKDSFILQYGKKPSQWELPALAYKAWRCVVDAPQQSAEGSVLFGGGKGLIAGGFRKTGFHPLNRDFVKDQAHLLPLSAPSDDGMVAASVLEVVKDAEPGMVVALASQHCELLATATIMEGRHFQGGLLPDTEILVHVTSVVGGIASTARLLYQDAFQGCMTFGEAFEECGDKGFLTAHPRGLIVHPPPPSKPTGKVLEKKGDQREEVYGLAACTSSVITSICQHPKMGEACEAFVETLGDTDIPSEVAMSVLRYVVDKGGLLVADIQASLPQINSKKRKRGQGPAVRGVGLSDSEGDGGPDGKGDEEGEGESDSEGHSEPLPRARGRSFNKYGESRAAPKILNSGGEEGARLSRMAAMDREQLQAAQASADHFRARSAMLRPVIDTLVNAGVVGEGYNKQPTIEIMKAFICDPAHDERLVAWRAYKRAWGLQSQTVAWEYYFDFIHGGHVEHVTAKAAEDVSPKALVATYSDMTKKSGQAKKTVTPPTMPALGV